MLSYLSLFRSNLLVEKFLSKSSVILVLELICLLSSKNEFLVTTIKTYENRYQRFLVLSNFVSFNNSKRCVLEVDLEYPKELRKLHKGYPLVPDNIDIVKCIYVFNTLKIPWVQVFKNIWRILILRPICPNTDFRYKALNHQYQILTLRLQIG